MTWGRTKIDKCDKLFSQYIRLKAGNKCEMCGKTPNKGGLHASHYYSRAKESTRFDESNVSAICFGCHQRIHSSEDGGAYKEFMIRKIGKSEFDLLTLRAYTPKKKDRKMTYLVLKDMMRNLEEKDASKMP